jgi:hypothetical protein
MEAILLAVGWLAGALGVLLTMGAAGMRLAGYYWFAGFSTGTVLLGGMAAMLVGCLGFLAVLASRSGSSAR